VYALTKGAIAAFTKGLARDLGPRHITVNNVQPGPTDTEMNPAKGEFAEMTRSFVALGRYAQPNEIASFVAYLASPAASYMTGGSHLIDGGYTA
jgi:3-oxoacyl-[acyl-carrier protein] reductase